MDAATKRWIRNASDERAAANGCRFDEARGRHVISFAQTYLRLYEGEWAGQVLEPRDWQVDVTMRLFGWERFSDRWGRWIRRFNAASIWVPKKNKKSPTLAWWGLYLLVGDGEQGQKVFFGAKDGQQAREIAGKHAIEMALQSDELMAQCAINKSLMQITHLPTRSILRPLSSGDSKTQKSKEGINGSILIDETHVVDREFINRISRAGISRSEPLHIEVSTAGNDPESYGRERYDYGKAVESGAATDEQLFFFAAEAPQDLTNQALGADPAKWGKLANPAWGHTVHEEEYLADYQRSKVSVPRLAEFKMYRLNIWQQSANPWLNMQEWDQCKRAYRLDDLKGRECYAGLDLAKTRDTCALVLIFPEEDGTYRQWPIYWIPKDRAQELRDKVRYLEWGRAGYAILTDGNVTDYAFIRQALTQIKEDFYLLKLAYDDHYAAELIQRLVDEDLVFRQDEVTAFRQTIQDFAGPTDQYEGLVREGKLLHPGNPLFTWQAGNVNVKCDANQNKRPVKPAAGEYKSIDGMVAAIMALEMCLTREGPSKYDSEGLGFL